MDSRSATQALEAIRQAGNRGYIKESCLERMILFGEGSLRKATHEFIEHNHYERNHQSLGNRLIMKEAVGPDSNGATHCRQRLGGMLKYYHRQAPYKRR